MLEQLESLKDNDVKLQHNKAVAKFYNSSCRDYNGFLKSIEKLKLKEVSINHIEKNGQIALEYISDAKKISTFLS